jgi:predicted nucleotidyltransferase
MKKTMLESLKNLKEKYKSIGFIIVGIFGSYAKDEEKDSSDIDIVYTLDKKFVSTYGWGSVIKLEEIKEEIKKTLNIQKVDLATIDNNSKTFQEIIKKELVYV